uniref:Uncharacterized protein n=1 Tax=viral metagenome TaxID=1070528 RepID=A0A6C0H9Y4_9ZZZZ
MNTYKFFSDLLLFKFIVAIYCLLFNGGLI